MSLSKQEIKHLRQIGHQLNPVVSIGENGVSDGALAELDRALEDHELIKVKLAIADREDRTEVAEYLLEKSGAELVQKIGKIILIKRAAKKPNPKLSNLLRPLG